VARFGIGSLNPFEQGLKEYYLDSEDLIDAKSAALALTNRKNVRDRLNIFEGVTQYQGIVISEVRLLTSLGLPNLATGDGQDNIQTTRFVMKVHIPLVHDTIGNPCDVGELKQLSLDEQKQLAINRIKNHPWFIGKARAEFNNNIPAFGSRVLVEFKKGPNSGRMIDGVFLHTIEESKTNSINDFCSTNLSGLFQNKINGLTTIGGVAPAQSSSPNQPPAQTFNSSVIDFSNTLQTPNTNEYVIGNELTGLTSIVEAESAIWKGKKENDPSVYSTLKKYWDNVPGWDGRWSATGTPWSAAFVSYVITRVDTSFPKSANHNAYSNEAKKNVGGWTAWRADKTKKYKAQVGDILVYARQDPTNPQASHGDTVYKISNNVAHLAGGNLGDSVLAGDFSAYMRLPIDKDGFYSNFSISDKNYIILLKKNGRVVNL